MQLAAIVLSLITALPKEQIETVATEPYRVTVWLDLEPDPRFTPGLRVWLHQRFRANTQRSLGSAWQLTLADRPASLPARQLPTTKELLSLDLQADKLIWLQVSAIGDLASNTFARIVAYEYDFRFDDWSVPEHRDVRSVVRLGDALFEAACSQFRPHATVIGLDADGKVQMQLKGLALQPVESTHPLAPDGMPFRVFREYKEKDQVISVDEVPYTFLLYRSAARDRLTARCDLVSALHSPLSRRTRRRSTLYALGSSRSAQAATQVQFVTGEEKLPVVGLEVSLRPQDRRAHVPVGTTDQHGMIRIRPVRLASELGQDVPENRMFELRLSTGDAVVASFPLLPGETDDLEVAVQVDALLTEVSGMIVGLQDEMLDAVVSRRVLGTQLEQLAEANDIDQAKQVAEKLSTQPNLAHFENRLKEIKDYAEKRRQELERPTLGGAISRLYVQTENLLKKFGADLLDRKIQVASVKDPEN